MNFKAIRAKVGYQIRIMMKTLSEMGDRIWEIGQMTEDGWLFVNVNVNVKVNEDGGRLTFVDTFCRYKL